MKAVKIILILLVVGIFLIYFMPSDLLDDKEIENEIEEVAENESMDLVYEVEDKVIETEINKTEDKVVKETLQEEVENIDAQNHLAFKGIPIAGSMELFTKRLKEKGFSRIDKNGTTYFFEGDFTGRAATVAVASTENGNVYSVTVFFTPSEEWNKLVETYSYYKKLYIRKYGTPIALKDPTIEFNTIYHSGTYTIFAACNMRATEWDPSLTSFSDPMAFMDYICIKPNVLMCRI